MLISVRRLGFQGALMLALAWPLEAQSHVSGRVYERQGAGLAPIYHAQVTARSASDERIVASVQTDDFGGFVLQDIPAGDLIVQASHPRYYPASTANEGRQTIRCPSSGPCGEISFGMLPAGDLQIDVVDTMGLPVDNILVSVTPVVEIQASPRTSLVARAHQGIFRIGALRPGRYQAIITPKSRRGKNFYSRNSEFEVAHGAATTSLRMVLQSTRTYRVSGRVVGFDQPGGWRAVVVLESAPRRPRSGSESAPANVQELEFELAPRPARLGTPIDRRGFFVLNGVPPGSYRVNLVWPQQSQLAPTSGPQEFLGEILVSEDLKGLRFSYSGARPPE